MRVAVYFLSDGTALTAAALGRSLLTQFQGIDFELHTFPFIDTPEKARSWIDEHIAPRGSDEIRPLVLYTLADPKIAEIISAAPVLDLNIFGSFIGALERHLGRPSSPRIGQSYGIAQSEDYERRIAAIHFTLDHDDGLQSEDYAHADLILAGVSRTGKTPTSLYLAMQFGLCVANYPFTEEDFSRGRLPGVLRQNAGKTVGLTTTPERLQALRANRHDSAGYSGLRRCTYELGEADALMRGAGIAVFDSTEFSIEEISARILVRFGYRGK
ncbi:MAG: kinase/pyrophosphorylase [Gammaproteobacteria bacterium AqS3]|nr:kinase/pyrophosphorylase [Gammaproteobacteria bacterium AqS3]